MKKKTIFGNFLEKKLKCLEIFDIQMAIFRKVSMESDLPEYWSWVALSFVISQLSFAYPINSVCSSWEMSTRSCRQKVKSHINRWPCLKNILITGEVTVNTNIAATNCPHFELWQLKVILYFVFLATKLYISCKYFVFN